MDNIVGCSTVWNRNTHCTMSCVSKMWFDTKRGVHKPIKALACVRVLSVWITIWEKGQRLGCVEYASDNKGQEGIVV